jgi:hypothetical protein
MPSSLESFYERLSLCDNPAERRKREEPMHRILHLAPLAAVLTLSVGSAADAYDKHGTRREQSARHYCWKRIGLKVDEDPTTHQAEVLRPCVKKRLGYDDPYMEQF